MQPLRSWKVERPDRLCLDRQSRVWVLQRPQAEGIQTGWEAHPTEIRTGSEAHPTERWKALRFTPSGQRLPQAIEFPAGVDAHGDGR